MSYCFFQRRKFDFLRFHLLNTCPSALSGAARPAWQQAPFPQSASVTALAAVCLGSFEHFHPERTASLYLLSKGLRDTCSDCLAQPKAANKRRRQVDPSSDRRPSRNSVRGGHNPFFC